VLTYFVNDFEMVPVAPIITGITLVLLHYILYYYYYITAIGLTPGGSSIHLHKNRTQNTEGATHITITKKKLGSAGRASSLRVIPWHLPYN
jgi:hypothetical protein